jgi:thymidine phosphorylase
VVVTLAGRGFVVGVDGEAIGRAVVVLGGGRTKQEDPVDPAVGVLMEARIGDDIEPGQTVARVRCRDEQSGRAAARLVAEALSLGETPVAPPPLVHEVLR